MHDYKISFIVPVYYKSRKSYVVKRANQIIDFFKSKDDYELIIGDASNRKLLSAKEKNIHIIDVATNNNLFSPADARNKAAQYAKGKYLFFFDVDLGFGDQFIKELDQVIEKKLAISMNAFLMLPCLYLTKKGTNLFQDIVNPQTIIEDARQTLLRGENEYVARLAVNTSAIILKKEYFEKLGGFSHDFLGHGGEDFEFLHRLAAFNPHSRKESDYYIDEVNQFIGDYKGFRKYLVYYGLENVFTSLLLVHRWHSRSLFNNFYFKRVKNEALLVSKMKDFDNSLIYKSQIWKKENKAKELVSFIHQIMLKYGYDQNMYPGLFGYQEGVVDKSSYTSKIRKLITRPKQFFLDIKLIKKLQRVK